MTSRLLLTTVVALCASADSTSAATATPAPGRDTFHSATVGFTITKPSSWRFTTGKQIVRSSEGVRLKDRELEALARASSSLVFVAIMKHLEPYPDQNPSVQVLLRPLGRNQGVPPVELMRAGIPTIQRGVEGFAFVDGIQATKVGGRDAAYSKFTYRVEVGGKSFAVLERLWMVPRGTVLFNIDMTSPPQGADASDKEFAAILASIRIED